MRRFGRTAAALSAMATTLLLAAGLSGSSLADAATSSRSAACLAQPWAQAPSGESGCAPANGDQPGWPASRHDTPDLAASASNATGPAAANANGGDAAVNTQLAMETARGTAVTSPWAGGDGGYLRVHALGSVARMDSSGHTVWERDSNSLYRDWHLIFQQSGYTATPQLVFGTDAADPFELTSAESYMVRDTRPYAIGQLTPGGGEDVAIAETVGVNLSPSSCFACAWPFSVPGSSLHLGTFVTVLDGQTGKTLYSELDPGFVTQLAIVGNTLVVGDETGSPQTANGIGQWLSATDLRGLTFRSSGSGLSGQVRWTYSTGAPWARLLAMAPTGSGGIAFTWSDTPMDLGVPGPPDGHVVLLDASSGAARWDVRTSGYPVLAAYDGRQRQLAVVEEEDPSIGVSYSVDGLDPADGHRVWSSTRDGSLPTTLAIAGLEGAAQRSTGWLVGSVDTTQALVRPPFYSFTQGRISMVAPGSGHETWSDTLTTRLSGAAAQPGALATAPARGGTVVAVASWVGTSVSPTPADPVAQNTDLQGLDAASGRQLWDHTGDSADPLTLSALPANRASWGSAGTSLLSITQELEGQITDPATGKLTASQPLMGDLVTGAITDVNGDGTPDLLAGDQSGGVYAFDGRHLSGSGATSGPRILWQADVAAPVHKIVLAQVGGRTLAIVARTGGVTVLDARTGQIVYDISMPGAYVWTVAVSGGTVVVPTDVLSAYSLQSGRHLWTWSPAVSSYFSNVAVLDGTAVAEYMSQPTVPAASRTMAAVGVDLVSGSLKWQSQPSSSTANRATLYNGVAAGPQIPGAGGNGAAFTWSQSNGQGLVDVRDVATGALLYSAGSSQVADHVGYLLDPGAGLLAWGQLGTVDVQPGSASVSRSTPTGLDAAFATTSDGSRVFVVANADVSIYPASIPSGADNPFPAPLASNVTFLANHLLIANFSGGTGDDVVTMPVDWQAWQVVNGETGLNIGPYLETVEHGLAVLGLTGTAGSAAPATKSLGPAQSPPTTLPLASPARGLGTAQPALSVEVMGHGSSGPRLTQSTPAGYPPSTVTGYLGLKGDGSGQTIAIVDAYSDPNITGDVNAFSSQFGLPQACSGSSSGGGCFHLNVLQPDGTAGTNAGWGLETSLDAEWAHAIAPQATIDLVEAHDGTFASMFSAVDAAAASHPGVISNSWGIGGEFSDEGYYDHHCQLTDSLCVVSSGDDGYPGSYPAYNPAVLAVGGTTLKLQPDGTISSELAWSGSGGGRSYFEDKPGYQNGVAPDPGRGIPDVSFDADPNTGVAVYDTEPYLGQTGWWQVGGTSVGAPAWSAILATVDQVRTESGKSPLTASGDGAQQAIYGLQSGLADITAGPANGSCPDICQSGPGYDYQTGLGSPRDGIDTSLAAAP